MFSCQCLFNVVFSCLLNCCLQWLFDQNAISVQLVGFDYKIEKERIFLFKEQCWLLSWQINLVYPAEWVFIPYDLMKPIVEVTKRRKRTLLISAGEQECKTWVSGIFFWCECDEDYLYSPSDFLSLHPSPVRLGLLASLALSLWQEGWQGVSIFSYSLLLTFWSLHCSLLKFHNILDGYKPNSSLSSFLSSAPKQ